MNITVFGAAGRIGRRVVTEALSRGHRVTAVVRNPNQFRELPVDAIARIGDATKVEDVVKLSAGSDAVINATRSATSDIREVVQITRALMDGLVHSGARLLVVGGAASLRVPGTGRLVIDDPDFLSPAARSVARASFEQFEACQRETQVDWSYLSPPAELVNGERTGRYRLGRDELVLDHQGKSTISMEDLAVVLLDELESPKHHQTRFTAAY